MKVLVIGGAGYLGSNLCLELNNLGHDFAIIDDFKNAHKSNIERLSKAISKQISYYEGDACDKEFLDSVCRKYCPDYIVHYANKKYIPDSLENSLDYYENNLVSTINVLRVCEKQNINGLLFASSIAVYADSKTKIKEDYEREFSSPYAKTKIMAEEIITDWQKNNPDKSVIITRYTNPVGASNCGLGDRPLTENINVLPYLINKVRDGGEIVINGGNFPTRDGSAVRDFIHVTDLAKITATLITNYNEKDTLVVNVGTGGEGYSVKELIEAISNVLNKEISFTFNKNGNIGKCDIKIDTSKLKDKFVVNIGHGLVDIIKSQIDLKQED